MLAKVAINARLARGLDLFDYKIPAELEKNIQPGTLVEIFYRNKKTTGVVFNLIKKSEVPLAKLKKINKILVENFLPIRLLDLIILLADNYFISKSLATHIILPPIIKKYLINNTSSQPTKPTKPSQPKYFIHSTTSKKLATINSIIKEDKAQNKQTLIICPEVIDVKNISQALSSSLDYLELYSNQSQAEYFKNWQAARQKKIIIGTKQALFAPLENLGTIIIDQANHKFHKNYDQNPRYHVLELAEKISQLGHSQLAMLDEYQSLKAAKNINENIWELDLKTEKVSKKLNKILIETNLESFNKNFSLISYQLEKIISQNLSNNKKTFCFLNKKGLYGLTRCFDCGHTFSCQTCGLPFQKMSKFICRNCGSTEDIPLFCPDCQGQRINSFIFGQEAVKIELQKIFPQAKIITYSKDKRPDTKNYDIILATSFAFKNFNWDGVKTFAILDIDSLLTYNFLNLPDTIYGLITKCQNLCIENYLDNFILQTSIPENKLIKAGFDQNQKNYLKTELQTRQQAAWPPFTDIYKIFIKNNSHLKPSELTKQLKIINNTLSTEKNILETWLSTKKSNDRAYEIIFRTKNNFEFKNNTWQKIPQNWLIDKNPFELV